MLLMFLEYLSLLILDVQFFKNKKQRYSRQPTNRCRDVCTHGITSLIRKPLFRLLSLVVQPYAGRLLLPVTMQLTLLPLSLVSTAAGDFQWYMISDLAIRQSHREGSVYSSKHSPSPPPPPPPVVAEREGLRGL